MAKLFSKVYKRDLIGIDIGEDTIKLVEGYFDSKKVRISKCCSVKTPIGAFSNGKIRNIDEMVRVIKLGIEQAGMNSRNLVYTVDSSDIIDRHIEVPTVKNKEVQKMLDFEIPQQLPIVLAENVIQTRVVNQINTEEAKKTLVLVVAMDRNMVDSYLSMTKMIGRDPYALDTVFNSMDKMLRGDTYANHKDKVSEKTVAFIDIGHSTININIYDKRKFVFNRVLNFGSKDIDTNIANFFNLDAESAREKKEDLGNINELYESSDEESIGSLLSTTVKSTIDRWSVEMNKIFKYFISREFGNSIDQIYVYGGGSRISGLDRYFEDFFDISTSKLTNLSKVSFETEGKEAPMDMYANAIASLIRLD